MICSDFQFPAVFQLHHHVAFGFPMAGGSLHRHYNATFLSPTVDLIPYFEGIDGAKTLRSVNEFSRHQRKSAAYSAVSSIRLRQNRIGKARTVTDSRFLHLGFVPALQGLCICNAEMRKGVQVHFVYGPRVLGHVAYRTHSHHAVTLACLIINHHFRPDILRLRSHEV
jgi:hypothetical protein